MFKMATKTEMLHYFSMGVESLEYKNPHCNIENLSRQAITKLSLNTLKFFEFTRILRHYHRTNSTYLKFDILILWSWVWVIENSKHKNLSTFSSNIEDVFIFSELINNLRTRPILVHGLIKLLRIQSCIDHFVVESQSNLMVIWW